MSSGTPDLSILFAYRNRDTARIKRCLDSLLAQTYANFEVIFVNTGSDKILSKEVEKLVTSYPFARYIYTETRGLYWNKAQALNIAAKKAQADYILSTDIDMIYARNFVEALLEKAKPDKRVQVFTHWLPEHFDQWENIEELSNTFEKGDEAQVGGALLISKKVYLEIGGYDEYYRLWGLEDRDFTDRLSLYGLETLAITNETSMFHQWHRSGFWKNMINYTLPTQHFYRKNLYYFKNKSKIIRNSNGFGCVITREQRPILDYVSTDEGPSHKERITFHKNPYYEYNASELIRLLMQDRDCPVYITNLHKPKQSATSRHILKYVVKLEKMINRDNDIGMKKNLLLGAIDYVIMEHADVIKDYFIDFKSGYCLVY